MQQEKENLIPLNLWLAGRSYRILVKSGEEEKIQKAVKIADEKITELKQHYAGRDDQDFVAMCLLTYAAESNTEDSSRIMDTIRQISVRIDEALE